MNDNKIQIIKDDEIDLRALFQVLWNDRKRIIQITAVVTLMGVFYALLATPLYKSTITMYPTGQESGGQLSQLQGMASTFGFDVGGGDPSFHIPDIVMSRRLKTKLIYHDWNSEEFDKPVNLIQYWEIDDTTGISLNPINWIKALFASSISFRFFRGCFPSSETLQYLKSYLSSLSSVHFFTTSQILSQVCEPFISIISPNRV